ncbi:DUF7224 domain-containing protein [Streptomyces bambusae]|uniref:DUF7224 domain-containing protein n=1 Tax=Streptomyces bambusae TaxID=1550616 RepID=A0ABS6Z2D8_9ACTN|nr:hypothetical protein [Streptomyces bambusae]MBW5481902.1 hypothetical protein [Streptomyces bambusae]
MRWRTLLRTSSATALLPFLLAYVVVLLGEGMTRFITPHYGPAVIGRIVLALAPAAAACAAGGAWEAARLRRGRVQEQAPVRSPLAIAASVLLPVWGMGLAGLAAALVLTSHAAGALPALSHLGMLAALAGVLAASSLWGYLLGRVVPGIAAAPIAMVVGFCAVGFPVSFDPPWLRHLVGQAYDGCCEVGTVIDPAAVWSPLVFAAGLCAAGVVVIQSVGRAPRALAVGIAVVASVAAFLPVRDMGYNPFMARDSSELVCDTDGTPKICLWPETPDRDGVGKLVRARTVRLQQAGLPVADTFSAVPHPGEAAFGSTGQVRPDNIPLRIANTFMPGIPECARTTGKYPASPARSPLDGWLTATAEGTVPPPAPGRFSAEDLAVVRQVLARPRADQLDWYEANRKALSGCTEPPRLDVPGAAR